MAVGRRKDQQLIDAAELELLRERAQDGIDMRAALQSLKTKRYQMMEIIRERKDIIDGLQRHQADHARGWIEFESDLGDALLKAQAARGEDLAF